MQILILLKIQNRIKYQHYYLYHQNNKKNNKKKIKKKKIKNRKRKKENIIIEAEEKESIMMMIMILIKKENLQYQYLSENAFYFCIICIIYSKNCVFFICGGNVCFFDVDISFFVFLVFVFKLIYKIQILSFRFSSHA